MLLMWNNGINKIDIIGFKGLGMELRFNIR